MIYTKREETLIATGYTRIVTAYGKYKYYEIPEDKIVSTNIFIPWGCEWRTEINSYYIEYRTKDMDYVMIYYQMKKVKYADYKIHYYYINVEDVKLIEIT